MFGGGCAAGLAGRVEGLTVEEGGGGVVGGRGPGVVKVRATWSAGEESSTGAAAGVKEWPCQLLGWEAGGLHRGLSGPGTSAG